MPLPIIARISSFGERRRAELREQRVHRRGEVVNRVEQRAVEIERDRAHGEDRASARAGTRRHAVGHPAFASSARIRAIVAA